MVKCVVDGCSGRGREQNNGHCTALCKALTNTTRKVEHRLSESISEDSRVLYERELEGLVEMRLWLHECGRVAGERARLGASRESLSAG